MHLSEWERCEEEPAARLAVQQPRRSTYVYESMLPAGCTALCTHTLEKHSEVVDRRWTCRSYACTHIAAA
jgi:hypothetical protein